MYQLVSSRLDPHKFHNNLMVKDHVVGYRELEYILFWILALSIGTARNNFVKKISCFRLKVYWECSQKYAENLIVRWEEN